MTSLLVHFCSAPLACFVDALDTFSCSYQTTAGMLARMMPVSYGAMVTRRKTKSAQGTLREAAVNTLLGEQLRSQGRAAQPGGVRQVCGPSCAAAICSYSSAKGRDPPRSCGAEAGEPHFHEGRPCRVTVRTSMPMRRSGAG